MESVMITGAESIERARWLAVRSALRLEIAGLKASGSRRSARVLANEITGQQCRTRVIAYDMLNAHIAHHMGERFSRPRTA